MSYKLKIYTLEILLIGMIFGMALGAALSGVYHAETLATEYENIEKLKDYYE